MEMAVKDVLLISISAIKIIGKEHEQWRGGCSQRRLFNCYGGHQNHLKRARARRLAVEDE